MYKVEDKSKHFLKVFTLYTAKHYKTFVTSPTIEHKFEAPIVDFCFNQDSTTLFICLTNNKILIRDVQTINLAEQKN